MPRISRAQQEGEPLGAVWIAWDDKRAYYLLGGYDHSAKSSNAVALAMWRAIQFTATDLKLPEFDFEGSMIPAVERFFSQVRRNAHAVPQNTAISGLVASDAWRAIAR